MNDPDWLKDMSPRERATWKTAWLRTRDDYLTILSENPNAYFGEYDNVQLIFQMAKDGLLAWREDKQSRHTSMFTTLFPMLTDAGRAALSESEGGGE